MKRTITAVHAREILDSRGNPTSRSTSSSPPARRARSDPLGCFDRNLRGGRAS